MAPWTLRKQKILKNPVWNHFFLFHNKGLLPPPAQHSPLLCLPLSIWWSKHHDHDPKWPHLHCGTEWPEGQKLRHPGAPITLPGEIPALLATRDLISSQGWQCHLYLQCRWLPGSSFAPEVTTSGWKGWAIKRYDPSQKSHNSTRAGSVCSQPKHNPYVHNENHQWRHHLTTSFPQQTFPVATRRLERVNELLHISILFTIRCVSDII